MILDIWVHIMKCKFRLPTVALICCLTLFEANANAQEIIKACAKAEVQSLDIAEESEMEILLEEMSQEPSIEIVGSSSPTSTSKGIKKLVVVALGPMLGSMDSHQVETDLKCTEKGLALTVMLTRSAYYQGSHLKNVLWKPKIQLTMVLHQPEAILETTWKMRLTTGAPVHHTRIPPYPDQKFPIILSKTLR
jgi:hypothetical protein